MWGIRDTNSCVHGNKAADIFEAYLSTVIFCYCPKMKIYGTLNKHFQQRYKMKKALEQLIQKVF